MITIKLVSTEGRLDIIFSERWTASLTVNWARICRALVKMASALNWSVVLRKSSGNVPCQVNNSLGYSKEYI